MRVNSNDGDSETSSENGFGFNSRLFFLSASLISFIILSIVFLMLFLHFVLMKTEKISESEIIIPSQEFDAIPINCSSEQFNSSDLCVTKDCTLTASILISAMDTSIDPCEDFYKFSCNNFIRQNTVPDHLNSVTSFFQYDDKYNLQLKDLIENYNLHGEPDVVFRMQESYHLCINTSYDKEKERYAFTGYILDKLGGWPMAQGENWRPRQRKVSNYLKDLASAGIDNGIFSIETEKVYRPVNNVPTVVEQIKISMLKLDQTILKLNRIKDLEKKGRNRTSWEEREFVQAVALKKLLLGLTKLFGQNNSTIVDNEIKKISNLITYINEVHTNASIQPRTYSTFMTAKDLNQLTKNKFEWLKIINAKFGNEFIFNDQIKIIKPHLFHYLPKIFSKFSRRTITNFITWNSIFPSLLKHAGPEVEKLYEDYLEAKKDNSYKPVGLRWKYCLRWVEVHFPLVLTRLFVRKYVDRNNKIIVNEMIQFIQEAYKININQSEWIDDETKQRALEKADAIQRHIGYPEFIFNDTKLEEEYSYIPFVNSSHFINQLEIEKRTKQRIRNLDSDEKNNRWPGSPLDTNAYYVPSGNSIWVPSGILQLPFFEWNRLGAVNFGMIGSLIGHEIGHAFDYRGSDYNERGELSSWWTKNITEEFVKRAQCFINQYNEYCPEELLGGETDSKICVPGSITQGETIADNIGLKVSFEAYKMWVEKYGEEKRLPGMEEYSPEQLFFISFSYLWCENIPPDKWVASYQFKPHTAGRYRSIGALSNNEEFRITFDCQVGLMNRGNESCRIW